VSVTLSHFAPVRIGFRAQNQNTLRVLLVVNRHRTHIIMVAAWSQFAVDHLERVSSLPTDVIHGIVDMATCQCFAFFR
jgi:hypothetical protein